ncbi:DUF3987 domain-containing protein [Salinibacter altiplanensis]|uniref:DUF3987 domain-containing protein n=1 Tax=Salinibacter altiplanensis TaxID=1803181 RepID=UPI000C9F5E0B|nr:DUF3987 domain-containing protein [Salinibacter altiplanensis]
MNLTESNLQGFSTPDNGSGSDASRIVAEMAKMAKKTKKTTGPPGLISDGVYQALPRTLRDVANTLNEGHERDAFLTGALPVLAGCLPATQFWYGGHWLSLNLYTAVVAEAGSGKGKMKRGRKLGKPLDEHLKETSREKMRAWERKKKDEDTQDLDPKPPYQRLFLGADASAAAMKESLNACPHAVLFETEFKTLSTALSQEWGQFRDVLLKGFQNETVEVDRKSEVPLLIKHPAPSMAVSGTPGTFSDVIEDTEDGLFSRFAFYCFEEPVTWISQFRDASSFGLEDATDQAASRLTEMYRAQMAREEALRLRFNDEVKWLIDNVFQFLTERWKAIGVSRSLHSNLKRAAVRALRIAAIMHVMRHFEDEPQSVKISTEAAHIGPDDIEPEVGLQDAVIGLRLALTYLSHALKIAESGDPDASSDGLNSARKELNQEQRRYLDALPEGEFSTEESRAIAEETGIAESTTKRWRSGIFKDKGLLIDVKHGVWEKPSGTTPSREDEPRGHSCLSDLFGLLDTNPGLLVNPMACSGDGAPSDQEVSSAPGEPS